ncbi:hypothetical protein [Spirochaeta africana]|uniref:Lipocalin-like domain-containing protein n=1 Tax=Spirochaeta africana (strain ATCC 700263 / DSM 8902 / Z-7692) TaxID=889378 RepID=H9UGF2_SPIAZ|nr:hypothetical protein [Spirochaeta africana]AFG36595.1 hypothetical protein Spiaf_0492 [Spirochaeta africana DSM 8902]
MKRILILAAATLFAAGAMTAGCDLAGDNDTGDTDPYGLVGTWYRSEFDGEYTEEQTLIIRHNGTFTTTISSDDPDHETLTLAGTYSATATTMTINFTAVNGVPVQEYLEAMLTELEEMIEALIQELIDEEGMTREEAIAHIEDEILETTIDDYLSELEAEMEAMFGQPASSNYTISEDTLTMTDPFGSDTQEIFTRQ